MDGWKIVMIIGIVILVICFIGFIYAMIISKKDGQVADPIYGDITVVTKQAAEILMALRKQNRSSVCRVSRGIVGIQVEVASSGEPPVHYNRDIRMDGRSEEQIHELVEYSATNVAHFTQGKFVAVKEYGDCFRIEPRTLYNSPPRG